MTGARSAIWRKPSLIGGCIAAFCYALLAWASGMDRLVEQLPLAANAVPRTLQARTLRFKAGQALTTRDYAIAEGLAQAAVSADPLDPTGLGLLGAARLAQGKQAEAGAAFRAGAALGWREPLAQAYWYEIALAQNDYGRAAQRADALLRQTALSPRMSDLLHPLTDSREGESALLRQLKDDPPWLDRFLSPQRSDGPNEARWRGDLVRRLGASGMVLGCERPARLAGMLLEFGFRQEAEQLWQVHCPGEVSPGSLADANFANLAVGGVSQSPFGWTLHPIGDVSLYVTGTDRGENRVQITTQASIGRPVLSQPIALKAGRYRLRAEVRVNDRAAEGRIQAAVGCNGQIAHPSAVEGDIAAGGQVIAITRCARPVLALWAMPGSGSISLSGLTIEEVR